VQGQTLDGRIFKNFADSLKPLICEMEKEYGVKPVYKDDYGKEAAYWHEVKSCMDKGEAWLLKTMGGGGKNLDRHKYSALLLVVLTKRPLFESDISNGSIGRCSAGICFAWKASLHLLASFIKGDKTANGQYVKYIESSGISIPSEEYYKESLRLFQTLFRPFKEERRGKVNPPFPSMMPDDLECNPEVWGFALLFANNFSLLEECSEARFERGLLYRLLKSRPSAAKSP